jgi:hypothetical protein
VSAQEWLRRVAAALAGSEPERKLLGFVAVAGPDGDLSALGPVRPHEGRAQVDADWSGPGAFVAELREVNR